MSIIEAALRRREQETGEVPPSGPLPPPLPPEPPPEAKRSTPVWVPVVFLFVFLAVAGALVVLLVQRGIRFWPGLRGRGAAAVAAAAAPTNALASLGQLLSEAGAAAAGTGEDPSRAAPAAPVGGLLDELARVSANALDGTPAPARPPSDFTPVKPPTAAAVAAAAPSAAGARGPEWPALKLKGVLTPSGSDRSTALIDNRMCGVGDEYKGVRIAEIRKNEIVVEMQGSRRTLFVGQSLP